MATLDHVELIYRARREKRAELQRAHRTAVRAHLAALGTGLSRFAMFLLESAVADAETALEAFDYPAGYVDILATDSNGEWQHG